MSCDRCGTSFRGNPQSQPLNGEFCSVACEEGRTPLPRKDPGSPGYPNFIRQNPEELVGRTLIAMCLKRTDYSPNWHKNPDDYGRTQTVEVDRENTILIYKTDAVLGDVVAYDEETDSYTIDKWNEDRSKVSRKVPRAALVGKLSDYFHKRDAQGNWNPKPGAWWVE